MRFIKSGPNIPEELIEAQKRGELLFFCGAGVSVPAGLPSFLELTTNVAKKLHALDDENSEVSQLLENKICDRTFTTLKRAYGNELVDEILLKELKPKKNVKLENHENLLKLSRNEQRKPFLITTNFDLLFEKVDRKIPSFLPPYLPDFQSGNSICGIVYLHGKWVNPNNKGQINLIISSEDFGRAYLSHGWATKFLSSLMKQKTVLLVGYSGDDLLVRYLLEGLKSENGTSSNKIYALDREKEGSVESKWSQLGAVGIPYKEHNDLWDTIAEWAKYANGNDDKWDKHIGKLASHSPKELEPFERGQVASYISSKEGAQKFQAFDPLPNAEWIYVFDRSIRIGDVVEEEFEDGTKVKTDPIELYGTDVDLTRNELELVPENLKNNVGIDYIGDLFKSSSSNLVERISNLEYKNSWNVDSRVRYLAYWFAKVAEQPAAIWWVQKQNSLHPVIMNVLKQDIVRNTKKFNDKSLGFWVNYLDYKVFRENILFNNNWLEVKSVIGKNKTEITGLYVEYFKDIIRPILKINTVYVKNNYLPTEYDQDYIFTKYKVGFKEFYLESFSIHEDNLIDVIKVLTEVFDEYLYLIESRKDNFTKSFFHSFNFPSINIEDPLKPKRNVHEKIAKLILLMCDLLKKQISKDESFLKDIVKKWPQDDDLIFNRLKLFIFTCSDNIKLWPVSDFIKNLSEDFFWNSFLELDLINFINIQWNNLNEESQIAFEEKVIEFRKNDSEEIEKYEERKIYHVGRLLKFINMTNKGLSDKSKIVLDKIVKNPYWKDNYLEQNSIEAGGMSGIINTDTSINEININENSENFFAKIGEVEKKRNSFFVEKKPFIGIVKEFPITALKMLIDELDKGNLREEYWNQFFENTSKDITDEDLRQIGREIIKLPADIIFYCRFSITRWVENHLINACINNKEIFWQVWDHIFNQLNSSDGHATSSAVGESFIGGRPIKKSRQTYMHAINSPVGTLVQAIFETYSAWNLTIEEGKASHLIRLEKALGCVGEGAAHATSIIMSRFGTINNYYKEWSINKLLPILNLSHNNSEAAWDGFFHQRYLPDSKLVKTIKPYFINLCENSEFLEFSKELKFSTIAILMYCVYLSYPQKKLFSNIELRKLIRKFDDEALLHGLHYIIDLIKDKNIWKTFGHHFFNNIWPKESSFQTSRTSEMFFNFLIEMPSDFKDIYNYLFPYLRKIDNSIFLYRITKSEDKYKIVESYPREILFILDRVIGQKIETYDNSLKIILEDLINLKPDLKNTNSWQRLSRIANNSN